MQFVKNGPDVPEKLIQAHEEGKVVFFCGAGISFPAGLPGFGELVWKLYERMGVTPTGIQLNALKSSQFDTAVTLLEAEKPTSDWRYDVRQRMAELLQPDYSSRKSTATHKALLQLSKTPDDKTRLVTTNFDRVFEKVKADEGLNFSSYKAPLLPIPKNRWDGLVYLHGMLCENETRSTLDQLVLSSGDFGLAYLTERWASSFLSELFRNYTVCFVGYSLNDPVLRYMTDALAADRLLGESPPEMYAFGNYKNSKTSNNSFSTEESYWRAKNVTPILYKNYKNHFYLHETIAKWAEIYRDGLNGKEQIVITTAFSSPASSGPNNDYTRRLAWALSDQTGIPAKTFSKIKPTPSLDWLEALDSIELGKDDLARFGIQSEKFAQSYKFSLFRRPAPSHLSRDMAFFKPGYEMSNWDKVMEGLGQWLKLHLNNPNLILFILKHGNQLHETLKQMIEDEIEEQLEHQKSGNDAYFEELKIASPDALIDDQMLSVWSLVLSGYCDHSNNSLALYSWVERYKKTSLTVALKKQLRALLSPRVILRKPSLSLRGISENHTKSLFSWDIHLVASHVESALGQLRDSSAWFSDTALLSYDFYNLLLETIELKAELGDVAESEDYSHIYRPSIKEHVQNRDNDDWTVLIDLLRDSLVPLTKKSKAAARREVFRWWNTPYPLFKRIALHGATESGLISFEDLMSWFIEEDGRWFWSANTQREVMLILRDLGQKMNPEEAKLLVKLIIKGPKKEWFREGLNDKSFFALQERAIWLRLANLEKAGSHFDQETVEYFDVLKRNHPRWRLSNDERYDFPFWVSEGYEDVKSISSPKDKEELVKWLKESPEHDHWDKDDWPLRCKSDFRVSSYALLMLHEEGIWIAERWREAIQVWRKDKRLETKARRYLLPILLTFPSEQLSEISWDLANWLRDSLKDDKLGEKKFLTYFDVLINLPYQTNFEESQDLISSAINSSLGVLTESLFICWFAQKPSEGAGINHSIKIRLEALCSDEEQATVLSRVIIAHNVLSLFRVDKIWTEKRILNWFDWSKSNIASVYWKSYIWSPAVHKPFLIHIKKHFLETAKHYDELGEFKEQYARFITIVALQNYSEFRLSELNEAFFSMPVSALSTVVTTLREALSGAADKQNEYWKNRVKVFLERVWPKNRELGDGTINQIALLCIHAKANFAEAYGILKHSLREYQDTEYFVRQLLASGLLQSYPEISLKLLNQIIADPQFRMPSKLRESLRNIGDAEPSLVTRREYIRLFTLLRQHET